VCIDVPATGQQACLCPRQELQSAGMQEDALHGQAGGSVDSMRCTATSSRSIAKWLWARQQHLLHSCLCSITHSTPKEANATLHQPL